MAELNIQLTKKQQELLLRGLRYVRSSVALEPLEYTDEVDQKRRHQYQEISVIETLVNSAKIVEAAAV